MVNKAHWDDRNVLVTGAAGFLGLWVTEKLIEAGANIVCVARDWTPVRVQLEKLGVSIVNGRIEDQALLERTLVEYEVCSVIHLAAQTIIPIANRNPVSTFNSNIRGTWTLLEACRRTPGIEAVVVASSDKAYGEQTRLPYTEDAPLQGVYPYDVSKSCADLIAHSYAATYGLPVAVTRCGNLYGGRDLNWNRIVPGTIKSVFKGMPPVIRSNGLSVRDYFYVEDATEAYLALAERISYDKGLTGESFNFSNEDPVSTLVLVKNILSMIGLQLEPLILDNASNEIQSQYLSSKKARRALGWKPRYSLMEGLRLTIDWYRAYLNEG